VTAPRYAIYAAPVPEDPLWTFGSAVIGYDAATGADLPLSPPPGFSAADWRELTADPRRYGFHGTLKPPFELAEGRSEVDLAAALDEHAAALTSITIERLAVTAIGRFVALCPAAPSPALERVAGEAVSRFDDFRAPLTPADRARRNPDQLTQRQRDHLDRWGYPYVFEDFRYHMTLTGRLPPERLEAAKAGLAEAHAGAVPDATFRLDALVLFRQARRDDRFRIVSRHRLKA
jgi:putative phosphonate metabolism protein